MFSKTQRFKEPKPSDVPPPGAFDPVDLHELALANKRGAMLEKTDRFKEGAKEPDNFGAYNTLDKENRPATARKPAAAGPPRGEEIKLRLQVAQLEKDLARSKDKVTRLEANRLEAAAVKAEHSKESHSLKSEIRALTTKLATATSSLEKKSAALPLLESQFAALTASHAMSKTKRDGEIKELRAERDSLRTQLAHSTTSLAEASHAADHYEEKFEMVSEAARRALAGVVPQARLTAVEDELRVSQLRLARLNRQLGDRSAQIEALAELAGQLEAELESTVDSLVEAEAAREWALCELVWEGEERDSRRGEKDWRQRARSDQREIATLLAEATAWKDEWDQERAAADAWTAHSAALQAEAARDRVVLSEELELAEGELEIAREEEIPRLEEELGQALADADELVEERERRAGLEVEMVELKAQTDEDADRWQGQLEQMKIQLAEKAKLVEREKASVRRVTSLLAQARASEKALEDDFERATADLQLLEDDRQEADELRRALDKLEQRTQMIEEEAAELGQINTELVSHENPHQRIYQVAKMRADLSDAKREKANLKNQLSAAQRDNQQLKDQLAGLLSVTPHSSHFSGSASVMQRSRVTRPDLGDVDGGFSLSQSARAAAPTNGRSTRGVTFAAAEDDDRRRLSMMGASLGGAKRAGRAVKESVGGGAQRQSGRMDISELI